MLDDPVAVGEALRTHSAPVFGARLAEGAEQHVEMFDEFIARDAEFGPWEWPRGEMAEAAAKLGRSAPRPDGVLYQVWGLDAPELGSVLDQIAEELAA